MSPWASLALGVAVALVWVPLAEARPYTVVSCDAAPAPSFSSEAWQPSWSLAGSAYAACPALRDLERGLSNRITGLTVPAFTFSAFTFTAPAGTSIRSLRWAGRLARNDCRWGTFALALPSNSVLFGLRQNASCASTGLNLIGTARAVGGARRHEEPSADHHLRCSELRSGRDLPHALRCCHGRGSDRPVRRSHRRACCRTLGSRNSDDQREGA